MTEPNRSRQDICDQYCPNNPNLDELRDSLLEVAGLSEILKSWGRDKNQDYLPSIPGRACVCDSAEILEMSSLQYPIISGC